MTHSQQRIAIAEACGWTPSNNAVKSDNVVWVNPKDTFKFYWLPDYLGDLNAMHEAEKVPEISRERDMWIANLKLVAAKSMGLSVEVIGASPSEQWEWDLQQLTASQRAEAFLRTLGKWPQ